VVLSAGGIGAGVVAVRSGKAFAVAGGVLGGLFVQALVATVILGFGVNAVFADSELRRYPLRAGERRLARHLLGILDPFWFLTLALEAGLAVGLYIVGAGSLLLSVPAVLLLFVSNYLLARVVALLVERLISKKGGSAILLGLIIATGFLPGALTPALRTHPHALEPFLPVLAWTPPGAAAAAMVRSVPEAVMGLMALVCWLVGLAAVLVALERRPARPKIVQSGSLVFEGIWERLGALFGPEDGPLVAQWLRYYSRNNRFRTIYPLAVPLAIFIGLAPMGRTAPEARLAGVAGAFLIAGFFGTLQFAVNLFGSLGGGFRRYFLLPANPAAILRAASYALLSFGAVVLPAAAIALALFSPVPLGAGRFFMFLGGGVCAMFLMHGAALWLSLYAPRRSNFYASFGNDLSLPANILVIGGMLTFMFGPRVLVKVWPSALDPGRGWIVLLLLPLTVAFYRYTLRAAGALLGARREHLLAVVEGRES
jgi:hypothetical protein